MIEFLESFDNRELAVALWLLLVLCVCLTKPGIRKSIFGVVKAFGARPILITFGALVLYFAAIVLLLSFIGLWNKSQLKLSLLWVATAGISSLFAIPKIQENKKYVKNAATSNFKVSVLFDFFVNLHRMPFAAEFIFVPIAIIFTAISAYSEVKDGYETTRIFVNKVLSLFGIGLFIYAVWFTTTNFGEVATVDNVRSLFLPILFSLTLLPFLWVASILAAYQEVFIRLQFTIDNHSLHPYIKWKLALSFRGNTELLNEWFKRTWRGSLTTKGDVNESIAAIISENAGA